MRLHSSCPASQGEGAVDQQASLFSASYPTLGQEEAVYNRTAVALDTRAALGVSAKHFNQSML